MKTIIVGVIAALTLVFSPVAAYASEVCAPKDAWTETIEHEAVGVPTITVSNPDHVPAVLEQTIFDGYVKWNWTGGKGGPQGTPPPSAGWHRVGVTGDSKGSTPDTIIHKGNGNGSYFYFETAWRVVPGTPAVGEPTVEVANPEYKAAWTETIEHPAVTCPAPEPPIEVPEFSTMSDVNCEAIHFYHSAYFDENGVEAVSYSYTIVGAVNASGEYTIDDGPGGFDSPADSKSYLEVTAKFPDESSYVIWEHVFTTTSCYSEIPIIDTPENPGPDTYVPKQPEATPSPTEVKTPEASRTVPTLAKTGTENLVLPFVAGGAVALLGVAVLAYSLFRKRGKGE